MTVRHIENRYLRKMVDREKQEYLVDQIHKGKSKRLWVDEDEDGNMKLKSCEINKKKKPKHKHKIYEEE